MRTLLIYCSILHLTYGSCRTGFELFRNGKCSGFYQTLDVHDDQAATVPASKCNEIQAKPFSIHNDADQQFMMDHATGQPGQSGRLLLGLACNTNTNRWQWADGSALDYKPPSHNSGLDNNCKTGCAWFVNGSGGPWAMWCDNTIVQFDIICTMNSPVPHPVPSADGCESFEDDDVNGICYQIGVAATDFQESQMICRSFGADVAAIHSQEANSFVRRLAVSKGAVSGIFLGATISGKGNDFGWTDGSTWDWDNFYPGFPMNGLGDCIIMDTGGTSGQWVNVDCSTKLAVACMRQQNYTALGCSSGPFKEGQIIYSPGFPFDASTPCDFILSVDAGKRVELEIFVLEANTCCDQLIVYENYFGANVIANLTGEVNDKIYTTSSSNFMRVSWQPNGGVNVRGMMMTFRGV